MKRILKLACYFGRNVFGGLPFPVAASFDLTSSCNLHCKHCYFRTQESVRQMDDGDYLEFIQRVRKTYPTIFHATWVGGEPLIRAQLLERVSKHFSFNLVVTNGTYALPDYRNCAFSVSIDGTEEYHDTIRGAGTYRAAKRNIGKSNARINLACVLNTMNRPCIQDLIREWRGTNVGGIVFDFYTPIRGKEDGLWLDWGERDAVIVQLLQLKDRYGTFIRNSPVDLEMMLSKNAAAIHARCMIPDAVRCYDASGSLKRPCVIGPAADCSRCGCIVCYHGEAILRRKGLASFSVLRRIYT